MKVYLCGGINGLTDAECSDWREHAKARLHAAGIDTIDPMRRDYRGKEDESVDEIVEGDEADIQESDVILANAARPSWGTAMEIRASAKEYKKFVISVVPAAPISPWLRAHSDVIFARLDDALNHVVAFAERVRLTKC
jgi:hypothetical protein